MIKFIPIKSGSSGNCYIVESSIAGKIILELGIPWKEIQSALNFKTSEVSFAIGTHRHGDHLKKTTVSNALKSGVDLYVSEDSAKALEIFGHHRVHILEAGEQIKIDDWTILPFNLIHDVPCLGVLIYDGDDRLLFIPDTQYIPNRFPKVNIMALECNYDEETLTNNILNGNLPSVVGHRTRRYHASLDTIKNFLLANDLSETRELWLIHLSNGNSVESKFIKEIQEITGIPVKVAC